MKSVKQAVLEQISLFGLGILCWRCSTVTPWPASRSSWRRRRAR